MDRQRFILQRIARLEQFFLEGIPVVGRFLAQYLAQWNGKDLFYEILPLMSFIQITDFEELEDCILTPLIEHFNLTFSHGERLVVLQHWNKLLQHWIR